jgi:hypothetical protein
MACLLKLYVLLGPPGSELGQLATQTTVLTPHNYRNQCQGGSCQVGDQCRPAVDVRSSTERLSQDQQAGANSGLDRSQRLPGSGRNLRGRKTENVGPSLVRSFTASVHRHFSFGSVQATFARARALDRLTGQDVPEAPRLIWDVSATSVPLPYQLRASAGFEYVGQKPLGGRLNGQACTRDPRLSMESV